MVRALLVCCAVLAAGGCGTRSPLDPFPARDGALSPRDGGARRDGGPDAGRPPPAACVIEATRRVEASGGAQLPAAALATDMITVVFTTGGLDFSVLQGFAVDPRGELVTEPVPFADGRGGALAFVPEFGAHAFFAQGPRGTLVNGAITAEGRLADGPEDTEVETDTFRPALVVTERVFGLAWNQPADAVGLFGLLDGGGEPEPLFLPGRDPWAASVSGRPDYVRLSTIEGDRVYEHTVPALSPRDSTRAERALPGEVAAARVVADAAGAGLVAVGSVFDPVGTASAYLWVSGAGGEELRMFEGEGAIDVAAAHDERSEWTLAALSSYDSRGVRGVPRLRVLAVRGRASVQLELPEAAMAHEPSRPALVATAEPGRFLLVWDLHEGEDALALTPIVCR